MTHQATDLTVRKTITVTPTRSTPSRCSASRWVHGGRSRASRSGLQRRRRRSSSRAPAGAGKRGIDGSECDWGRVLSYDPPDRLVLNWQIGADWRYDVEINSEVEVRFIAEGETGTRIELEHRGLTEAYRNQAEQVYAIFDSSDGWSDVLERYRKAACS